MFNQHRSKRAKLIGGFRGLWASIAQMLEGPNKVSRRCGRPRCFKPDVEVLESRIVPAWSAIGPAPQSQYLVGDSFAENVAGRVTSLAYSANYDGNNHPAIFEGTAGGGVERGTFAAANPNVVTWQAVSGAPTGINNPTLLAGTAAIGALAVDPTNPRVIYAGTGEANYSIDSNFGAGILRSADGGTTWTLTTAATLLTGVANPTAFYRQAISKIIIDPTVRSGGVSKYVYAAVVPAAEGGNSGNPGEEKVSGTFFLTILPALVSLFDYGETIADDAGRLRLPCAQSGQWAPAHVSQGRRLRSF